MRKTLLVGLVLAAAAVLVVLVSAALDLELESVALLGVAVGAVVALVPDRTPLMRLAGFAGGLVAAWIGYLLRAGLLPDSAGGRSVAVAVVVLLCVGVFAAGLGRIPLWSALLGAASLAGAFEYTYLAAPPEVASTSFTAVTSLLLASAVGFLCGAVMAPEGETFERSAPRHSFRDDEDPATHSLDEMMETTK
jgi:hypothetical protein